MQGAIIAHTGNYKGARIPIEGELIIGKDPACCNLILEGVSVKNRHCRITYREHANMYVVEPFIGGSVLRENGAVLSEGSDNWSFFPEETFRIGLGEDCFEFVFPEEIKQRKHRDEKRPDSVRIVSCPFPFVTDGLDEWSDASNVSCWLKLKAGAGLSESIAECAEWISFNRTNNRNDLFDENNEELMICEFFPEECVERKSNECVLRGTLSMYRDLIDEFLEEDYEKISAQKREGAKYQVEEVRENGTIYLIVKKKEEVK